MHSHQITSAAEAKAFMLAGNATFTLVSAKTGQRFTYKVQAPKESPDVQNYVSNTASHFVKLMNGPDNENSFVYMGMIARAKGQIPPAFLVTKKAKVRKDAPSSMAFAWAFRHIVVGNMLPATLEFWHEGRCGRCGRKLTVPGSIAAGIGPECAGKVMEAW